MPGIVCRRPGSDVSAAFFPLRVAAVSRCDSQAQPVGISWSACFKKEGLGRGTRRGGAGWRPGGGGSGPFSRRVTPALPQVRPRPPQPSAPSPCRGFLPPVRTASPSHPYPGRSSSPNLSGATTANSEWQGLRRVPTRGAQVRGRGEAERAGWGRKEVGAGGSLGGGESGFWGC